MDPWVFLSPADPDDFFLPEAKAHLLAGCCPHCGTRLDEALQVDRVGRHKETGTGSQWLIFGVQETTTYQIQACYIPICQQCHVRDGRSFWVAIVGFAIVLALTAICVFTSQTLWNGGLCWLTIGAAVACLFAISAVRGRRGAVKITAEFPNPWLPSVNSGPLANELAEWHPPREHFIAWVREQGAKR